MGSIFYDELYNESKIHISGIKKEVYPKGIYIEEFDTIRAQRKSTIFLQKDFHQLRNKIIYFSRKLKSQKLVSICEFGKNFEKLFLIKEKQK